nr:MAG TPA: hypothetical protein [Caudoviricetes sp.]
MHCNKRNASFSPPFSPIFYHAGREGTSTRKEA